MTLKFYNTLTRKNEDFVPIKEGEVSVYTCGPTVYNYAHIGNFRGMMVYDIFKRYLKYRGFKVKHVMNITDVDDKTIRDSQKEGKSLKEFTEFYTEAFLNDLKTLNIDVAETLPKASEEIDVMVEMVKLLLDKGFAYKSDNGDIYFSISKMDGYGELARLKLDNLKKNADGRLNSADEYEKEDARDFALWKAYTEADGDVFWDVDIGKGRPGWHLECSAMSRKYLNQPFDVHMGGEDLIFPHHTNEIAQSEAAYGKKFCNYWLHNAFLIVNGEKMSKSLGNFFTLRDLLDKGYDAKSIRYALIRIHYRQKLDFREDDMKSVKDTLQRFYDFLDKLCEVKGENDNLEVEKLISSAKKGFEEEMDNDLNISGALAAIFTFMTEINKIMGSLSGSDAQKIKDVMFSFDSVLGVMQQEKVDVPEEVLALVKKREEARTNKNWAESDNLRDEIKSLGFIVEDNKDGSRVKKA